MNQQPHEPQYPRDAPPQPAPSRRRGGCCGCVGGTVVALLFAVALFYGGWRYGDRLFQEDPLQRLAPQAAPTPGPGPQPTPPPAGDQAERRDDSLLDRLRGRVADIQDEWEGLQESGEIEQRLETLREEIEARRESAGKALSEGWQEALDKSEELLDQAREKTRQAPEEAQELIDMLQKLRKDEADAEPAPTPTPPEYAI